MRLQPRLEKLRDGRPKTWVAKKLGVSISTVTNWEQGDTMMPYDKARELAELLGITMEELYEKAPR